MTAEDLRDLDHAATVVDKLELLRLAPVILV